MQPIFIIVGPPAVGKSTTSCALAARFSKSLHIPVDDLREMVVSGLILPSAEWSDALAQQISLARASAVHMALAYSNAGFAVVIDDFMDPNHAQDYQLLHGHPAVKRVILFPEQDAAHQRNLQRSGDSPARAYIDDGIRLVYQQLHEILPQLAQEGWRVIDTTQRSVDDTVEEILR
jgi:hypothetical protein